VNEESWRIYLCPEHGMVLPEESWLEQLGAVCQRDGPDGACVATLEVIDVVRASTLDQAITALDQAIAKFREVGVELGRVGHDLYLLAHRWRHRAEEGERSTAASGLPDDLAAVLRDQSIVVPQDASVWEAIAAAAGRHGIRNTESVTDPPDHPFRGPRSVCQICDGEWVEGENAPQISTTCANGHTWVLQSRGDADEIPPGNFGDTG